MIAIDRDKAREVFREALLQALDAAALKVFSHINRDWKPYEAGANDADLPRLFLALDRQIETLAERYGVAITDNYPTMPPAED